MLKLYLKKIRLGYKICVSGSNVRSVFNKKLALKPRICVGYIVEDKKGLSKSGYLVAIDFSQLNYWLFNGVQFTSSSLKFLCFLDEYLYNSKSVK